VKTCPRCGEGNEERAHFCWSCGEALAEERPAGEERKVLSVLFVDLVGFTARSDRADPEDVRATLRPYHTRLRAEIERFGGTVEKFVGDAVMAVFGAPVTHEDDAERAVRTALRIVESIEELNAERPGPALAVRAAVDSGEAVISLAARPEQGEGIAAGDVVNTASRLQQTAPVGGVVVGEGTFRATAHVIEYRRLEPVALKGKAEPVPLWLALSASASVRAETEPRAPYIGRDEELALLQQTYARTTRESSVQLTTVTGEPGVGKSRLLLELRRLLSDDGDGALWRRGRCLPYGDGITFWALAEVVKEEAGILESDGPERASAKLAAVVDRVIGDPTEREWFRARLAPLVGLRVAEAAEPAERTESFTAWRRFLEAIAAERPLVVVFEDLHWADGALLEFIDHFVGWASGVPLLVLCTARPELYARQPGWGGGKRNSTTIALSPLSGEETARLVSLLLGQAVLPAEVQVALLERAGGNPLYAEEFVRMLIDRGILERRGRHARIASDAAIQVPETVQALLAARLDTLPPERKALLHDAAVIGRVFWAGALCAMGGREASTVEEGLHELAQKEFVRPTRTTSVRDEAEYAFWHVLVRDAAYAQIPRRERMQKHCAAAAWIERLAGERVDDRAEILAHHYGEALELALAMGDTAEAEELRGPTRRILALAGERALELDVGRADGYLRRALELSDQADPERALLLVQVARAAWLAGRLPEAERGYEEAIEELQRQGDVLAAGEAMVALVASLRDRGETQRSHELLDRAIGLLEREPPGKELALAYLYAARDHALAGRGQEALEWSTRAFELSQQLGLDDHASRALQFRGMARYLAGDLGSVDDMREALRISLELGLGYYTVNAYGNLAEQVWQIEGPEPALEIYRAGIDFGEQRGIVFKARWIEAESLWSLFDADAWDELLVTADRLVRWDDAYGGSQIGVIALTYGAFAQVWRGELAQAAAAAERFLPRARTIQDPQVLAPALAAAALIASSRGDGGASVAHVAEFERTTRREPGYRANHAEDAVRACVRAGAHDLASSLLEDVEVSAARHTHGLVAARAVLAESQAETERALALYRESARGWAEFGFVLGEAAAVLGESRCLRALGDVERAAEKLAVARGLFDRLGARPVLAEAAAPLGSAAMPPA
jgi:class 3 adenylate cyclase/tetratricopeptide (TPR) repeat protein